MYIDATLQPTRLLTYLLKRLHLHFLRSMHSQDVTRWILPVTSRDNRNYFCLHVLPCDRKSSSLPSTEEAKSSFFHPACITCSQKRHVETSWREEEMGQVKGSGEVGWEGGEREEKTPACKHCENEKHLLVRRAWLLFWKWVATITKQPNSRSCAKAPIVLEKQAGVYHCFYLDWVTMQFSTADEASV